MPDFIPKVQFQTSESPSDLKLGKSVQELLNHCSSIESQSPIRPNLPFIGRQTSMMVLKKKHITNTSVDCGELPYV